MEAIALGRCGCGEDGEGRDQAGEGIGNHAAHDLIRVRCCSMQVAQNLRFGLVGPGRRRQGLGPFLAAHAEAAGARVVAAAGRDLARTEEDALQLSQRLGHAVTAHASVAGMATREALDALIIAAPVPAHREALEAALAAGLPVLCEKPLVAPGELDRVGELLDRFLQAELLLMEHCQWPLTLPALTQLHPGLEGGAIDRVELMICPGARGRQMIEDSLSHLLSLVQALVPVDETTALRGVEFATHAADATSQTVSMELEGPMPSLVARLRLEHRPEQPRPAWLAVNGLRMDREIELPGYKISFTDGDRSIPVPDPAAALVYRFVQSLTDPDEQRIRKTSNAVRQRARLYAGVLDVYSAGV